MKPKDVKVHIYAGSDEDRTLKLFLKALELAEDGSVLFISKNQIQRLPEDLKDASNLHKDILKRITFVYPSNSGELTNVCSTIHTWKYTPRTIIVNGFDDYLALESGNSTREAFVCAAIADAANICGKIHQDCNLIVSFDGLIYEQYKKCITFLLHVYFGQNVVDIIK